MMFGCKKKRERTSAKTFSPLLFSAADARLENGESFHHYVQIRVVLRPGALFCLLAGRIRNWRTGGNFRLCIESLTKIFNNLHQLLRIGFLGSLFSKLLPVFFRTAGTDRYLVSFRFRGAI